MQIKDLDFERKQICIRDGKGEKDRFVPLPTRLETPLQDQVALVRRQHANDILFGAGWVWLPYAFDQKDPNAARSFHWQYLFPAANLSRDKRKRAVNDQQK